MEQNNNPNTDVSQPKQKPSFKLQLDKISQQTALADSNSKIPDLLPQIEQMTPQMLEDKIEQGYLTSTFDCNFESSMADQVMEALLACDGVPDDLKRKLIFLQSDSEMFVEVERKYENSEKFMMDKIQRFEKQMASMKEQLGEKDIEIKIMKREKDEFLNSRLELALENKRLKNELEKLQTSNTQVTPRSKEDDIISQYQSRVSTLPDDLPMNQTISTPRSNLVSGYFKNFWGNSQKKDSAPRTQAHHRQLNRTSGGGVEPSKEEQEDIKQVINDLQQGLTSKVLEIKRLNAMIEDQNALIGNLKLELAKEKDKVEDEKQNQSIYKKEFQKLSEIVASKDNEVQKLKLELQKMKATYENDIKKMKKTVQHQGSGQLHTLGNEDAGRSNQALSSMYATQPRPVPASQAHNYRTSTSFIDPNPQYRPKANLNQTISFDKMLGRDPRDSNLLSARIAPAKESFNQTLTTPASSRRVIIDQQILSQDPLPVKKTKTSSNKAAQSGDDNPFSSSSDPEESQPQQLVYKVKNRASKPEPTQADC